MVSLKTEQVSTEYEIEKDEDATAGSSH